MLAGVDHFYLYDNESPDNQREVAAPYVKAGLVDYIPAPGQKMQYVTYNDAIKRFKFMCRYMAFIDGDEFIYPKSDASIVEVVDDILSQDKNAAGLAINWQCFGSNGQDKADYSRGVLERFMRRAPKDWSPGGKGNAHVKTIANPRMINHMSIPHFAVYFENVRAINENSGLVGGAFNKKITSKKIVINHYHTKSREEYAKKVSRGAADHNTYQMKNFDVSDRNEEFDDGILKYRDERAKNFRPPDKSRAAERLLNALMKNLSPTLIPTTPPQFYAGKMETFLTCRAVSSYLKTKLPDDSTAKFFEEAALKAILRSFNGMNLADARLFLRELPNLLTLPYPVVKDVRQAAQNLIPQMLNMFRINSMWKDYVELDYVQELLKLKEAE